MFQHLMVVFFFISAIVLFIHSNEVKEHKQIALLKAIKLPVHKNILTFSTKITTLAKKSLGKPYVYGKTGPESFDCSGFVYGIHKRLDITLPRTSLAQSQIVGEKLDRKHIHKGDLLFFDTSDKGHINHSGIYLGDGKFIHASSGKAMSVTISDLDVWYKDKFRWGKQLHINYAKPKSQTKVLKN